MTDLQPLAPWGDVAILQGLARIYALRLGCEAFPVVGKRPALGHTWLESALGEPGLHDVPRAAWEVATGYALTPVAGSTLVILESDDPTLTRHVLDLLPAFEQPGAHGPLRVRRGQNWHFYLRLAGPLHKAYLDLRDEDDQHVGSLRGAGAYVVGPKSTHVDGELYQPFGSNPLECNETQTGQLLTLFGATTPNSPGDPRGGKKPAWNREGREALQERPDLVPAKELAVSPHLVGALLAHFQDEGYRTAFNENRSIWWLNGRCPNHARHKRGDLRDSFGFNTKGVGYCFVCGPMRAVDVAKLVGIEVREARPAPPPDQRERRAELVAAGYTRAVRLLDLLPSLSKRLDKKSGRVVGGQRRRFTVGDLLAGGRSVGWSRATTLRNLAQAVEAGLLRRCGPGNYERVESFDGPSPARPGSKAFTGHPAQYRSSLLLRVERQVQPDSPSASNPSAARIAWLAGIQERTLYRYEQRLGIMRLQVWRRSPLPTLDGPGGQPMAYAPTDHLDSNRPTAYKRFEVVQPGGATIRRIPFGRWPGQALDQARAVAQEWQAVVLLSERRPSIRVLPGQDPWGRVPVEGRLSDDGRRVIVDTLAARRLPVPSPTHPQDSVESAGHVARKQGRRARHSNDSNPSVKHEIQGDLLHRQTRNLPGTGQADASRHWQKPPFITRQI